MIKHQPNDMVKYQQYIRRKWLVLLVMVILAVIASLASLMAGSAGLTLKEVSSRCVRERNKANIHHCLERANGQGLPQHL